MQMTAQHVRGRARIGCMTQRERPVVERIAEQIDVEFGAHERAIVVHGASYVGEHTIREHGKLGRSEGCFAVPEEELYAVLARLPAGHMIYADKA